MASETERTVYDILDELRGLSTSLSDKGSRFERLAKAYFQVDPMWTDQFEKVRLWSEWPDNGGKHSTGIDLVAKSRDTGDLTAIQAKFYEQQTPVTKADTDTFLSASGKTGFTSRIVITTNDTWSKHAEDAIKDQQVPVQRIGMADLGASRIDWGQFISEQPDHAGQCAVAGFPPALVGALATPTAVRHRLHELLRRLPQEQAWDVLAAARDPYLFVERALGTSGVSSSQQRAFRINDVAADGSRPAGACASTSRHPHRGRQRARAPVPDAARRRPSPGLDGPLPDSCRPPVAEGAAACRWRGATLAW